jgi:hypothetical protein
VNQLVTLFFVVVLFVACQKEDLRAPDFDIDFTAASDGEREGRMVGTVTNVSSTPSNSVSIRIDRYTDFNLVQDPVFIAIDKKLFQGDTAQFSFELSDQIKRVEIDVVSVQ